MTISTAAKLDALPHSAIVTDSRGFAWQRLVGQSDEAPDLKSVWVGFGMQGAYTTRYIEAFGPFEVLSDRALLTVRKLPEISVQGDM